MTKAAPKQQAKPAALPPRGGATPTKAQQAARAQGRPEPDPRKNNLLSQTRSSVPAVARRQNVADPATLVNMPAFMRDDAGAGKEDINQADMEMPRLKLMQGLSKELEAYNDLRPGHFFHSAAEEIFDKPFITVPIFFDRRYILWRPRDNGGGILARADDGVHWSPSEGEFDVQLDKKDGGAKVKWKVAPTVAQSGLANWGTMDPNDPNSPPAATLMYNYLLAFPEHPELMPAVFTFQRSGIKQGKRFNTKLKTTRTPLFGLQFLFTPIQDSNSRGQDFWNVDVKGAGVVEDEALYRQYKDMHEGVKGAGLRIKDIEGLQDEDPAGDNAGEGRQDDGKGHNRY